MTLNLSLYAIEALIIVHRAPLYANPESEAKILEFYKTNQTITLIKKSLEQDDLPYYLAYARTGQLGYIKREHVKVIFHSAEEYIDPIVHSSLDTTDERIHEPLPKNYPFFSKEYIRSQLEIYFGNNSKSSYDYQKSTKATDYTFRNGLAYTHSFRWPSDKSDRLYVGFHFAYSQLQNNFLFQDESKAIENRAILKVGGLLSYDFYQNETMALSYGAGLNIYFNRSSIKVIASNKDFDELLFSSINLSPHTFIRLTLPTSYENTFFSLGSSLSLVPPSTLKTSDRPVLNLWNNSSLVDPMHLEANFSLGVEIKL